MGRPSVRTRLNRLKQHLLFAEKAASDIENCLIVGDLFTKWSTADRLVVRLDLCLSTAFELKYWLDAQMARKDAQMERKNARPERKGGRP